jgi:hypothetical protein
VLGSGSGSVCVAILKSPWPNGQMVPLDDFGQPTNWTCRDLRQSNTSDGWIGFVWRTVTGGFGAVPGQPALLNYSTARIQVLTDNPQWNYVTYYY